VGSFNREGKFAMLRADLGAAAFADFRPDLALVTRGGKGPGESRILVGNTSLFHSLYWNTYPGQYGVLGHSRKADGESDEQKGFLSRLLGAIMPTVSAQKSEDPIPEQFDVSIENGRQIFFFEEFNGNGRRCGDCHSETNNFTIDPTFISTLSQSNPLFVAENNQQLAALENPRVMRGTGNILENVDGFINPGPLRGVPHTLALNLSDVPDANVAGRGFAEALGWSGDGSPTLETFIILVNPPPETATIPHDAFGTLRDFALGAVRQHFPRTLNRVPNVDFRFPSLSELNDLEAFQNSLGRQTELNLDPNVSNPPVLRLRGPLPAQGQILFRATFGSASCNGCHSNAGANTSDGVNRNFNTRVELLPLQPARLIDPTIPPDGGLGTEPSPSRNGGFGDGTFNTPPLIEAADTAPFFHNNSINTIELATQFYEFSFGPQFFPPNQTSFQPSQGFGVAQIQAIAAFLRAINALENIRSATALEVRALQQGPLGPAAALLELSVAELEDAIEVLSMASLHPTAIQRLREAIRLDEEAMTISTPALRNRKIQDAICMKQQARADIEQITPVCFSTSDDVDP
jgi:cytochrome c peroxidase